MSQAETVQDLGDRIHSERPASHLPANSTEAFQAADASDCSLQDKLDIYSSYSRGFFPETNQAYDEIIEQLKLLVKPGPQIGAMMPAFVLPDQNGILTSLDSLLANGPLVVSLNRGHWCPWCRLELRALSRIYSDVQRLNGQVISIMPETASYSRKAIEDSNIPFRILTDIDLGYTLTLGLVIWIGQKLQDIYLRGGLELPHFQNNGSWFLPIPATFVIGADGCVKARFADPDFRKRMEPEDILSALHGLKD